MKRIALLLISLAAFGQSDTRRTIIPLQDDSATGVLAFREKYANGSNAVTLSAPNSLAANVDLKLPATLPAISGSCLGGTTFGTLYFIDECWAGTRTTSTASFHESITITNTNGAVFDAPAFFWRHTTDRGADTHMADLSVDAIAVTAGYEEAGMTFRVTSPSTATINATSLTATENGNTYVIVSVGTTSFTALGASANTAGVVFVKSGGTGSGTGTVKAAAAPVNLLRLNGETGYVQMDNAYLSVGPATEPDVNVRISEYDLPYLGKAFTVEAWQNGTVDPSDSGVGKFSMWKKGGAGADVRALEVHTTCEAGGGFCWGQELRIGTNITPPSEQIENVGLYIESKLADWVPPAEVECDGDGNGTNGCQNNMGVVVLGRDGWEWPYAYLDESSRADWFVDNVGRTNTRGVRFLDIGGVSGYSLYWNAEAVATTSNSYWILKDSGGTDMFSIYRKLSGSTVSEGYINVNFNPASFGAVSLGSASLPFNQAYALDNFARTSTMTKDLSTTSTTTAHFMASGSTNTDERVAMGYNSTGNHAYVQAIDTGPTYTPLALQPLGGPVVIGSDGVDGTGATLFTAATNNATVYRGASTTGPNIQFQNSAGSTSSPTPLASGSRLGFITFAGMGSTVRGSATAAIETYADATFTDSSKPTRMALYTTPTGASTRSERVRIAPTGFVGINTTAPLQRLHVFDTAASPATSGTTQGGIARIASDLGNALDIGAYAGSPFAIWLQGAWVSDLSANYPIVLNPVGGNVGIGMTAPTSTLHVTGTFAVSSTSAFSGNAVFSGSANTLSGDLKPGFDGLGSIGTSSLRYGAMFSYTGNFASTVTASNIIPAANNTYVLGDSSNYWNQLTVDTIIIENSGRIRPRTANTGSVGISSARFNGAWLTDLNVSGTITPPSGTALNGTTSCSAGQAVKSITFSQGLATAITCATP